VTVSFLLIPLPNELMLLSTVGIVGGLYVIVRGFRLLVRKRLLLNTPTSKIRSASLGVVEVGGLATGPYTMLAPITGKPCFLYRTTAWQQNENSRTGDWNKVAEETLHVPFFLDDSTGQLLIEPRGAELDVHCDFRQDFSDTIFSPHAGQPVLSFLTRHGVEPSDKIRVEECSIKPNDALFIMGTLAENPGVEVCRFPGAPVDKRGLAFRRDGQRPSPTPLEVVRLSEPAVSSGSGEITQQSTIAAALTKAGITSPAAWAAAGVPYRSVAVDEAPQMMQVSVSGDSYAEKPEKQSAFDLAPSVILMKGENNPAFLISKRSQHDLVRSLSWRSAAMIWGGAALTLLGLYVLLAQLELL
jgi:hypothetical protein